MFVLFITILQKKKKKRVSCFVTIDSGNSRQIDIMGKWWNSLDLNFMHDSRTWRQRTGVKTPPPPPLLACFIIRASSVVTHGRTHENTRWKHHHRNFNSSAQYVDTATTLLPCNRAPATNGQSTNMMSPTHVNVSTKHADTTALHLNTRSTTVTQPWCHDHLKWTTWNTYVQSVSKTSQQRTNIISTGRTITL